MLRSIFFITSLTVCVPCLASWSIETDRSTEQKHGLFEIREEARRFVAEENAKGQQQWALWSPMRSCR